MFLRSIYTKAIGGNFEFTRRIAKRHEREDPDKDAYGFGLGAY